MDINSFKIDEEKVFISLNIVVFKFKKFNGEMRQRNEEILIF